MTDFQISVFRSSKITNSPRSTIPRLSGHTQITQKHSGLLKGPWMQVMHAIWWVSHKRRKRFPFLPDLIWNTAIDNDIKLISGSQATAGLRPRPASRHRKHPKSFGSHRRGLAKWDSKPKSVRCITTKNAKPTTFSNLLIKEKFDQLTSFTL